MISPEANAAFVAGMEEVLEVYRRPHDPKRPLICLDETSKQLISETRAPIPMKPGSPARYDYEYERNGVANLFMMFAPLEGWRHVKVTDRHTAIDYAQVLKEISDVRFADAEQITLVQDNLNIHDKSSLYKAFPAPEARRLVRRFEWVYTPKHGSWLDWRSWNSRSSPLNVWIVASPTKPPSNAKSPPGPIIATSITPRLTGASQPRPLGSSSRAYILSFEMNWPTSRRSQATRVRRQHRGGALRAASKSFGGRNRVGSFLADERGQLALFFGPPAAGRRRS